jgi:hypothetical protein
VNIDRRFLIAGFALVMVSLACTCNTLIPGAQTTSNVPQGTCDPQSTSINVDTLYTGRIEATDQPYPANCAYYCLWVPSGTGRVDVDLTNFSVDLDMYVGTDDISSVLGAEPDDAQWRSNDFGTDDESIRIRRPSPNTPHYIEICSYEGAASDFELQATSR